MLSLLNMIMINRHAFKAVLTSGLALTKNRMIS